MVILLSLVICIIGLLMYALAANPKLQAIGKDMFWVGLLVFLLDADKIVIEGKSSGTQLIQDLQNDGVWKVVEYKPPPGADKVMRLHACSDRFESGRVVLPRKAPWLDEYILELIGFPGTKHDDQVDSTTQALDYLREPDLVATYVKAFLG